MRLRTIDRTRHITLRAGFTLVELLVVVAILLVLISIATPLYLGQLEKSRMDIAVSNATTLAANLRQFAISHDGQYPPENTWDLLPLPPEKKPPMDPWNQAYQWALRDVPQPDGTSIYDPVVWSLGPRGNLGPADELSSVRR